MLIKQKYLTFQVIVHMGLLLPPFIVLISLFAVKVAGEWLIFES